MTLALEGLDGAPSGPYFARFITTRDLAIGNQGPYFARFITTRDLAVGNQEQFKQKLLLAMKGTVPTLIIN